MKRIPGNCDINNFYLYNSVNPADWYNNNFGSWVDWETFPWSHESLKNYYIENQRKLNKAISATEYNCYGFLFDYYTIAPPANWNGQTKAKLEKDKNYGNPGGLFPWGAGNIFGEVPSWLWIILIGLAAGYFLRK